MPFEEPVYRPPMEARSLLLPVMQSCTWNKCNFCYRLKDYPLKIARPEELEAELRRLKPFHAPDADVFLVGSNAFAVPAATLEEHLKILRRELPAAGNISMFSRVDAIARKTDEELRKLRSLGLTRLYVGTENGNNAALALMNKGHSAEEAGRELGRLDAAGIRYTLFYILGMGGQGTGQACALDTARLFNAVRPERIVSTGMTVTEGTGAARLKAEGRFREAGEREKIEELRTFLASLTVDTFYDGIHMLNPLHFRFRTSDEKARQDALKTIDKVLSSYSDAELEAAIDRRALAEASTPRRE